jgi:hypothetical protein
MITFGFAIAEHYIGANFSGWLYVLPVFMDLVLIGRASVIVVKK